MNIDDFDNLLLSTDTSAGICDGCKIPMVKCRELEEYRCENCGRIEQIIGTTHQLTNTGSTTRIRCGRFTQVLNISGDYLQKQRNDLSLLLRKKAANYTGIEIPAFILSRVADIYNNLQAIENVGEILGGRAKKFVRRGNVKDQILAAILYYVCMEKKIARKKTDIAKFMALENGFSEGDNIIRTLYARGKIEKFNIEIDETASYAERYLSSLSICNEQNLEFVKECMNIMDINNIAIKAQISSCVVACIWFLIKLQEYKITHEQLEEATDKCKKSTYLKIYGDILKSLDLFVDVVARIKNVL